MCSTGGHTLVGVRGFPIRKSWDRRLVIDSSRLIADSHVLHRLLLPRHPPCALKNLATQGQALNEHPPNTHPHQTNPVTDARRRDQKMTTFSAPPHTTRGQYAMTIKIRCSRPLCSSQTTTRTTPRRHPTRGTAPAWPEPDHRPGTTTRSHGQPVLLSQDPTVCQHPHAHPNPVTPPSTRRRDTRGNTPSTHSRRSTTRTTGRYDQGHYSLMFHP